MQKHSSKNTSVNIYHLPAVYSKVNWRKYANTIDNCYVIDIGCGRIETQALISKHLHNRQIRHFVPYDPNHQCLISASMAVKLMNDEAVKKVIVCSNVLNVIDNESDLNALIASICNMSVIQESNGIYHMNPCYITVYEGDKSGIGRETKRDCWQRNEQLMTYLGKFNDYIKQKYNHNANFFTIKYGMIVGATQYGGHISYE